MRRLPTGTIAALPWDRVLLGFIVLSGLVSIIVILDYTAWPSEASRHLAFEYLVRLQDIGGAVLLIAVAVLAYLPRTRPPALDAIDALGRHPVRAAAALFGALSIAMFLVVLNHPLAGDEHLILFQAKAFAAGHLTGQIPPELAHRVIPPYHNQWLIATGDGHIAAVYWPGFALLLVPFIWANAPWACNPLLAAGCLLLIGRLAGQLTGSRRAAGWAMLLAVASPGFIGLALSYFAMTAQLFFNLLFAWLLLGEPSRRRTFAAGAVGSFALVLGNPVPHLLFALPWLAWVARQPGQRTRQLELVAGYVPLALLIGLGWWLFLRQLQEKTEFLPYAQATDLGEHIGNRLWYLFIELRKVFELPSEATLGYRRLEQVRLWTWASPGLPLLALVGWWVGRRTPGLRLLGLSLASTLVGYLLVGFDQGYGWGARYVHPAWGALPILAAAALNAAGDAQPRLQAYVARVAMLSLVFCVGLRLFQIHLFMQEQLALRPPFAKDERQVVFMPFNPRYYTQDFVQNDPFLRDPVIFMVTRGPRHDAELMRRLFPGARVVHDSVNGQVWRYEQAPTDYRRNSAQTVQP